LLGNESIETAPLERVNSIEVVIR